MVKADWDAAQKTLEGIAKESGGRLYSPKDTLELTSFFGDIIENLKVRYVIAYHSSSRGNPGVPRTVRVELLEPGNGKAAANCGCQWQARPRERHCRGELHSS
jgi:hypothetical protein